MLHFSVRKTIEHPRFIRRLKPATLFLKREYFKWLTLSCQAFSSHSRYVEPILLYSTHFGGDSQLQWNCTRDSVRMRPIQDSLNLQCTFVGTGTNVTTYKFYNPPKPTIADEWKGNTVCSSCIGLMAVEGMNGYVH